MDVSFGERELDVLGVLWKHGPGTVPEVRERLGGDLAYNTVLTVLRNLEAKGVVSHEEAGRQHRYFAVVAEDRVQRGLVTRLVDKVFSGSPLILMTHLVEGDGLTADDVRALQQLLDERIASRTPKPE
ncbi:MAG: BlaI/MecI/CopY family transcriptional regulator [Gemmatimonadaceae bacterium]|nr:BlaI/MecI/CopY family transcriptional regulator [Gemmatimonadaceae bacterium]